MELDSTCEKCTRARKTAPLPRSASNKRTILQLARVHTLDPNLRFVRLVSHVIALRQSHIR